ncbi:endonuclease/exonuclease/phosphatase [Niabella beijingensis]|uniref:endonuclease/exonuclease/phosphatase family protein n=1 Tax=Niabella beijingensis TaxID=2872700 RepID=UPI001CBB6807|nr:endonuclease/exonuclease/phosphatase [Niabella beijingensis]MBZ4189103.1 endonuclease/exonuclease/phosphatase [Niabella beijingensis]
MLTIRCFFLFIGFYPFCSFLLNAQPRPYQTAVAAFYNLENLYDTLFHGSHDDAAFTPDGVKAYTGAVFREKLSRLASVISRIGTDFNPDGPALLGVAEVENQTVLDALLQHPFIASRGYRSVHYDSRDARGLDVALVYNPRYFRVLKSRPLYVKLPPDVKDFIYTRDILWVTGLLNGQKIQVFVNHWPSRFGGEKKSAAGRMAAALTLRKIIDTLIRYDPMTRILVMGDLNDEPVSSSVTKGLRATSHIAEMETGALYNPWARLFKNGQGTLAYQNAWSLFDQILLSEAFLDQQQSGLFFYKNEIFKTAELIENRGAYKGYPLRSYSGDVYRGGYSDHFPVYIVLIKKVL